MVNEKQKNNRIILKATSLLGGSSIITILIGMIKTKFVAVLLGPSGVGFISILNGFREVVSTIINLGLSSSGIRQIAAEKGKGDQEGVLQNIKTLRILVWTGGVIGIVAMIIGAKMWSIINFQTEKNASSFAWLGLAIFAVSISVVQNCILQGERRIKDIAKANILGAIFGAILSIFCFLIWGSRGIVASLIVTSFCALFSSWWYVKKLRLSPVFLTKLRFIQNARELFIIGLPIAASGLVSTGTIYIIRLFLSRTAGLEAVGMYQAAFSLASVLVNFVLAAMGTDYYPRLSAISTDNNKINNEVNSQTEIALLLAVPALTLTITFLPIFVNAFYSNKFSNSIPILRWAVFGIFGRVVSWPMSFIILAKAKSALFLFSEIITSIIHIILIIIGYKLFGLPGCGIAFAVLYLWYIIWMKYLSKIIAQTHWTRDVFQLVIVSFLLLSIITMIQLINISIIIKYAINIIISVLIIIYSIRNLSTLTGISFWSFVLPAKRQTK